MSDKGRDRAIQLVVLEVSDDFTKHTLLSSTHEHEQKDSSNETRVIVTHNSLSAVNCPIIVEIVPFSCLSLRFLSISQSTHCCQQKNTSRETAQTLSLVLQVRHRTVVALNNTIAAATEILFLANRRLPTTETSQRLVQRFSVGRVYRPLSQNSDEPAAGGYLHGKEIYPSLAA